MINSNIERSDKYYLSSQEPPSQEPPSQESPSQEPPSQESPSQESPSQEPPSQEPPSQESSSQEFSTGLGESYRSKNDPHSRLSKFLSEEAKRVVEKILKEDLNLVKRRNPNYEMMNGEGSLENLRERIISSMIAYSGFVADLIRENIDPSFSTGLGEDQLEDYFNKVRETLSYAESFGVRLSDLYEALWHETKAYLEKTIGNNSIIREKAIAKLKDPSIISRYFLGFHLEAEFSGEKKRETSSVDERFSKWLERIFNFFGSETWGMVMLSTQRPLEEVMEENPPFLITMKKELKSIVKSRWFSDLSGLREYYFQLIRYVDEYLPLEIDRSELKGKFYPKELYEKKKGEIVNFIKSIMKEIFEEVAREYGFLPPERK